MKAVLMNLEKIHFLEKNQKTLARAVRISGIGVHSGKVSNIILKPAPANYGIKFKRINTTIGQSMIIDAVANNISSTQLSTSIGKGDFQISTIEHLMSALYGLGIDNLLIEIDGPEMPILDGSSKPFVEQILLAGEVHQNAEKKFFVLLHPVEINVGNSLIKAEPSLNINFDCTIDFGTKIIGKQNHSITLTRDSFLDLSDARTFCLLQEWELLKSAGLGLGGSLDNAVVVGQEGVLNQGGLRHSNEFVKHKLLDAIGDFYLLGAPLLANYKLYKPGHAINACFTQYLLENSEQYLKSYQFSDLFGSGYEPAESLSVSVYA